MPLADRGTGETSTVPDPLNDPEIEALEAIDQEDHDAALRILMDAHGTAVYRYCRQLTGDAEVAEEVQQMTFVQAYEGFERFAGRSSLKTWLFSIARHRCLDALKIRRRRWRRFQQTETLPEDPDPRVDTESRLVGGALQNNLSACLDQLRPPIRDAVLLRFQEGFSYVEMEHASGERAPTLQARVARAMPMLRRCLEARGWSP